MEDFVTLIKITTCLPNMSMLAVVQEAGAGAEIANAMLTSNNIWMMLCTGLVFIMHLGFATVETGFTQSKDILFW